MSKHNFTPGPWRLADESYDDRILAANGSSVCKVNSALEGAVKNAHLIAAAPDLCEALVMVRDADDDCKKDGLPTMPDMARARIDKALAKAEGRVLQETEHYPDWAAMGYSIRRKWIKHKGGMQHGFQAILNGEDVSKFAPRFQEKDAVQDILKHIAKARGEEVKK